MTDDPRFYQIQTEVRALRETVDRQQRTIDALIASIPQLSQQVPGAPAGGRSGSGGKVFREWVSWLEAYGPAYRQEVMEGVGKPLPGNQPVVDWRSVMATWPDDAMPFDTLCKINGQSTGQGRPPTVYFLWKHRFLVHVVHGVGPTERPTTVATEPEVLLGVIHPPTEQEAAVLSQAMQSDTVVTNREPAVEASVRCASMAEWYERWNPVFDIFAKYGDKPSNEERDEMRYTLPEDTEGEDWSTILARSFHEAKLRSES